MIAFAAFLLAAALASWLIVAGVAQTARAYGRFAFALYAALAIAIAADARLADSVALLVCAVAPMMLALALTCVVRGRISTVFASAVLALASVAGIAAAATSLAALSFAPLLLCVVAMIAGALPGWRKSPFAVAQTIASSVALLAGASAYVEGGAAGQARLCAFSAAGLLGVALSVARGSDVAVENERGRTLQRRKAIRGVRG
jgi:hypothetical protein